ncbi:MAG: Transposase family protein [Verrucomicrobiales bacterium]|nr:Transposase family protein [Verrucomicrobiales bacterium]
MKKRLMIGMDLHSNNVMVGLVEPDGKRVLSQKLPCELKKVLEFLKPYQSRVDTIAVESTFNWYWLVDGLRANGYNTVLANPAAMEQWDGLKHTDDKSDAFFLADQLRLKLLPTGYIYNPKLRPVRDLLRRRMNLVHQRTALMLSFKSLFTRTTGQELPLRELKGMEVSEAQKLYTHPANQLIASIQLQHIEALDQSIKEIEKVVQESASLLPFYARLQSLPGVGKILVLFISMEVGDVKRFPSPGDFASYCRTVDAKRKSNGKKKEDNNQKCGNKYLAWAFVEAANFAKRFDDSCRRWFDRKAARTTNMIATKALACKLAKAAWYVMSQDVAYDPKKVFPELAGGARAVKKEEAKEPTKKAERKGKASKK